MSEKLVELASTFLWRNFTFRHHNSLEIRFEWVKVCFSAFLCKLCFSSNFAGLPFSIHLELGNLPHMHIKLATPSFISNWNLRHWMLQQGLISAESWLQSTQWGSFSHLLPFVLFTFLYTSIMHCLIYIVLTLWTMRKFKCGGRECTHFVFCFVFVRVKN